MALAITLAMSHQRAQSIKRCGFPGAYIIYGTLGTFGRCRCSGCRNHSLQPSASRRRAQHCMRLFPGYRQGRRPPFEIGPVSALPLRCHVPWAGAVAMDHGPRRQRMIGGSGQEGQCHWQPPLAIESGTATTYTTPFPGILGGDFFNDLDQTGVWQFSLLPSYL